MVGLGSFLSSCALRSRVLRPPGAHLLNSLARFALAKGQEEDMMLAMAHLLLTALAKA